MEGKELYIKGKYYSLKNLDELPQNISTHAASSRQDANYYGYFSELNPLSNFHPAMFEHDGKQYHSSEQFIQAQKAIYSNDTEMHSKIMGAKTAIRCKILGKEIIGCDITKWNSKKYLPEVFTCLIANVQHGVYKKYPTICFVLRKLHVVSVLRVQSV